jgi:hypothetical protein
MVRVAVDGDPVVTVAVPWLTPSRVIFTVPEGKVVTGFGEMIDAVTTMDPPAVGVRVDGVNVVVVEPLVMLMVTEAAVDVA